MNNILSIIVPVYNEELVIEEFYNRLINVCKKLNDFDYEVIFINDGSEDNTINILKEIVSSNNKIKILDFSRNFGHQIAITAGMTHAIGQIAVIIDADLQDPPELIPDMIDKWKEGYHVIYATREKRYGENLFKLLTAKYYYKFLSFFSDINIPQNTGDFRLLDRIVLDTFIKMPEKDRFVRGMISWIGFNQTSISYVRDARFKGKTKYSLKKMFNLANNGIISFSKKPLNLIFSMGIFLNVTSFLILIPLLITYIPNNINNTILIPIFLLLAFFTGLILICIGIVGNYIGGIYEASKNRPLFVIKEYVNIDKKEL